MSGLLQHGLRQIYRPERIAAGLGLWLGMAIAGKILPVVQTPPGPSGLATGSTAVAGDGGGPSIMSAAPIERLPAQDSGWIWMPLGALQRRDILIAIPFRAGADDQTVVLSQTP